MINYKHNTMILVVSNDGYADLWIPFFNCFFHYWSNCPLKTNLLTNSYVFKHQKVHNIQVGPDVSWSDNLKICLSKLDCEYIILFIEDLFLKQQVDNQQIGSIMNWLIDHKPNYVQLNATHKPLYFDNLMGKISPKTGYRTSLLPCIWRKQTLLELLMPGESAWDFEIKGSTRAYDYERFFATHKNVFNFSNGVIKGKWRSSVVNELKEQGIEIDISNRKVMTNKDEFLYRLRKIRSRAFNSLPARLRGRIKEFYV